ncbi:MprA protease, GlyGly-CTERM protein-sorting domain-containing form [Rhodococcus sp. 05-340-1]|jgi:MprA protease rhombosortase-interaction domain-containing protein|uniref:MprA protease, GlyGly-CTERM protein-sorting domain-containing form n=1 Tax=unclassified Rhodococcus (in: high G+C Gram-positive bacteria) TaxID=192944 RepID=UPI000B9A37BA|nr:MULTISPECIES: MprA protease, GlyGly-CTERM protein-sorting domain-containing form [unclassified Rhodococcus (in: high G+C Gram-positive bacteria)]OZD69202.1 MprA protease, GlyGly-CTERM protein-sorting domain-containing form [Rhodococcus sp. 05-340-2]OZD75294.1 MprA protease, GlyGly-CTERM protein-sorting domain-containing form [Rhodococcus sp. 05-340-1]
MRSLVLSTKALVVSVAALLMLLVAAPIASAHSQVTGYSPADGSSLDSSPATASVSFNEVPQSQFATLNVVGPDGNIWSKGDARIEGQSVVVDVGELGPIGEYTLAYRITSADGHPVSGTATFTLTQEGSGTPGAPADASGSSEESEGSFLGGYGNIALIAVAVLAFAGALGFALRKPKAPNKTKTGK